MTAKLHNFSQNWSREKSIKRNHYDKEKLKSVINQIKEGLTLGLISEKQYEIIKNCGKKIAQFMGDLDERKNVAKGINHSDLDKSNIIVNDNKITPIDFSLSGYGYFYMDIGGIIYNFRELSIRKKFFDGYQTIREIPQTDMKYIEGFFIMTILLFMATHIHNPNMLEWYLRRTQPICDDYIYPLINDESFYEKI